MTDAPAHKASTSRTAQLSVFIVAFALSHAFRTLPTVTVTQIGKDLVAGTGELGIFSGTFHASFALMQIPVGVALDRHRLGRTVGALLCAAVVGSVLCAVAPTFSVLLAGQMLLGIGCSPAMMAAMVLVSRRWPPDRFAAVSGLVIALGGLGMLVTATPLAWIVDQWSWRAAFALLALVTAGTTTFCFLIDDAEAVSSVLRRETLYEAVRGLLAVLREPQTRGIFALGLVSYSTVITVRGLWIVPLFVERHGLSFVAASNVVLAVSIAMIAGSALFGSIDPGPTHRRPLIVYCTVAFALTTVCLVWIRDIPVSAEAAISVIFGLLSSFYVLQYADVRSSYPSEVVGRALSALNIAVFLGVAVTQSASGFVAAAAAAHGFDPIPAVFFMLAANLCVGAVAYALLRGGSRAG